MCSTWRAVSRSDLLWQRLTSQVWGRTLLLQATWRDEFLYRHQTARNFQTGRYMHVTLHYDQSDIDDSEGLMCRCLALSDLYLACGFADGTVRIFDLATHRHINTFRSQHPHRFGRFSRAVSGIFITGSRLVFATLDGYIYVVVINGSNQPRPAHMGDVVNDGALVDFAGSGRWWVGLYAGVPGRAFHIWDAHTEELVFVGGTLTDPESVMGWHMLIELTEFVGRVRVTSQESAVACTRLREIVFDLREQVVVRRDKQHRRGVIATTVDVNNEAYVVVDSRGLAIVRQVDSLEQVCRFRVPGAAQGNIMGCMNSGYALICVAGIISVWEIKQGGYLYNFRERMEGVNTIVVDERHMAALDNDNIIHLWDFGAQ